MPPGNKPLLDVYHDIWSHMFKSGPQWDWASGHNPNSMSLFGKLYPNYERNIMPVQVLADVQIFEQLEVCFMCSNNFCFFSGRIKDSLSPVKRTHLFSNYIIHWRRSRASGKYAITVLNNSSSSRRQEVIVRTNVCLIPQEFGKTSIRIWLISFTRTFKLQSLAAHVSGG